jgi:Flp pilus assembly pilin Flp
MTKQNRPLLSRTRATLLRLLADERGATAVEYGMLATFLGVVISTAIYGAGDAIKSALYDKIIATLAR